MFEVVLTPVTESPFPYIDKNGALYNRASISIEDLAGIEPTCRKCRKIFVNKEACWRDANGFFYCTQEIKVIQWDDIWQAYNHPALDCETKGMWFQITDGTENYTRMRIMINNKDPKNSRVLDMNWGNWCQFVRGVNLMHDLLRVKNKRGNDGMIQVASMENESFLVNR